MSRAPRPRHPGSGRVGRRCTGWLAASALALLAGALLPESARAQQVVRLGDVGPGRPGRILRAALAAPHALVIGDSAIVRLPRDTVYSRTVLIVGASATVASTVEGDVIVVGGDLFLHPGAIIGGRAIAIGGGVYNSTLALVQGERLAFRDVTFLARREGDALVLQYAELVDRPERSVVLTGLRGFGLPEYTRVEGLSIPVGVVAQWTEPAIELEATLAYRTHLGVVDPQAEAGVRIDRRTWLEIAAGRGTFTNDAWIRGDILNSLLTFALGRDTRNYYRADRGELLLARIWESESGEITPFVGALAERAWSVGPRPGATSAPWSIGGRDDPVEGILRPNPLVAHGWIASARLGARALWEGQGVMASARVLGELPFETPDDSDWQQLTVDAEVAFPTFGSQTLAVSTHLVTSFGGLAPPQRFAYLGGSGTLPTFDLLSFGGDELMYAEGRYTIPIERIVVPYLGSPRVTLRYMIGSAGLGELPPLEQNLGVRLGISLLRVDWTVEPVSGDAEVTFGLTYGR